MLPARIRKWSELLVSSAVGCCLCAVAQAAEWDKSASVGANAYVSDNICFSAEDEQTEVVGTLNPNVRLSGAGARTTINLDAAAEWNTLAENPVNCRQFAVGPGIQPVNNRESFIPRLRLDADYIAIEDVLLLRADARATQNPINPFAAGGDENINGTGNTNISYQYGVGATVDRPLPSDLFIRANFDYDEQSNSVGVVGDSTQETADLEFGMAPNTARLTVSAFGRYRKTEFDRGDLGVGGGFDNELRALELRARMRLDRSWQINALAGEEDNSFFAESGDIDGSYWDVGAIWSPNQRVFVSAGYGERFFGETPRAEVRYRHKRSDFSLGYQRTVTTPRNLRVGDTGLEEDPADDILDPIPGNPVGGDGIPTFLGQGPVESESLRLSYRFSARRTRFRLEFQDSRQTRFANNSTVESQLLSVTANRRLGRSLSVNFDATYRDTVAEGGLPGFGVVVGDGRFESLRVGIGLSKKVAPRTSMTFRYSFSDQDSAIETGSIQENRISLGLQHSFFR